MVKKTNIFLVALIFSTCFSKANCQYFYDTDFQKETTITGIALSLIATSHIIDSYTLDVTFQDIQALNSNNVNQFDHNAINQFSKKADHSSDVLLYATSVLPFGLLFSSQLKNNKLQFLTMFGEVVALNGGITSVVKSSVKRFRPYAYNSNVPMEEKLSLDTRKSFFSGHTSHTAAVSFFAANVYADIYPNSKYKYIVWSGAALLPAVTGFLRYKAGKHFASDILTGYSMGALVGYLIPYLHKNKLSNITLYGSSNGFAINLVF